MNISFIKEESSVLNGYIKRLINLKPVLSNCFITDFTGFEYFKTEDSIILRKKYNTFYRIYLITINLSEIEYLLGKLGGNTALNIPSKVEIPAWENLLTSCGYNLIGTYERYFNPNTETTENFSAKFATAVNFEKIKSMMYGYFNPITDWLPDDNKLRDMIGSNRVIINEKYNEVLGFFIFTFEGKKCYFNCWYDKSGDGLYLLYNVYALMKSNNIIYSYFWIDSRNHFVKKIHALMGSKPDGLKDFTFYK